MLTEKSDSMIRIDDSALLKKYYEKYELEKIFTEDLFDQLVLMKYRRQENLCEEQEVMHYMMFIVEGRIKVFRTLANGKSLLLNFYEPLSIIGEVELIKESTASCTGQALTTCFVLGIPMEVAQQRLKGDAKFLSYACKSLADKLHYLGRSSSINLFYPLENRLASYINAVAVKVRDANGGEELLFNENLTHLADLLGTSYRHLLRTLHSLCEQGILLKEEKGYQVLDKQQLLLMAEDLY